MLPKNCLIALDNHRISNKTVFFRGITLPPAFKTTESGRLPNESQLPGDVVALHEAPGLMMGLALHLGRGLGANPAELAEHWIVAAKKLGARE
jgi:hypothetical protein